MSTLKFLLLCGLFIISFVVQAESVGSAFTYQGELNQQNTPANGTYNFKFELYDIEVDGVALTTPLQLEDVNVQNGVFTVELDFGSEVFDGTQLWLEIAVREGASVNAYTTLNPRQKITASPYSASAQSSLGGNCTAITSLPHTISNAGVYCFTGNLETSITGGNAITIEADNVVIDLNDWMLDGLKAGPTTSTKGVFATGRNNITVRNGTIRGFRTAILLTSGDHPIYTSTHGHLVEDIRAEKNRAKGIAVVGVGCTVRRNQVIETGGGSPNFPDIWSHGILVQGPSAQVSNNRVTNTTSKGIGDAVGISVFYADNSVVEENRIDSFDFDSGTSYGVRVFESDNLLITDNRVMNARNGIYYSAGGEGSTGKYKNNITSDVITPFTGGTDLGGNN